MKRFELGNKVIDRDGFRGSIVTVCEWNDQAQTWYEVRFDRGTAIRFDADLQLDKGGK